MFISFLYPFNIRDVEAPYLWVYYKQLFELFPDEIVFLGSEEYFYNPKYFIDKNRGEAKRSGCELYEYKVPKLDEMMEYNNYIINKEIFNELVVDNNSANDTWKFLLTNRYEPLECEIEKWLKIILSENSNISAILSWCNCPSLDSVAQKYGIKVIYNELGPFRTPTYKYMAYFDFTGVNGNTECEYRYKKLKLELNKTKVSIPHFDNIELLHMVRYLYSNNELQSKNLYNIGIALQVENDSNMLAYSNGFDNYTLIEYLKNSHEDKDILIREHPQAYDNYSKLGCAIDKSANSAGFIFKCNEIHTINSSVAIEAILYDKKTIIYGESPFQYLVNENDSLSINFAIIGYLIPYFLLFNAEYYEWRLKQPTEVEIYYFHLYCLTGDKKYIIFPYSPDLLKIARKGIQAREQLNVLRIYRDSLIKQVKCVRETRGQLIATEKQLNKSKNILYKIDIYIRRVFLEKLHRLSGFVIPYGSKQRKIAKMMYKFIFGKQ